jgi:hypothetical protein
MEDIMAYTTDDLPRNGTGNFVIPKRRTAEENDISHSNREQVDALINRSTIDNRNMEFLRRELFKLAGLPSGSKLINNINMYLQQNPNKRFSIGMNRGGSEFDGKDPNNLRVNIDLGQFKLDSRGYYMNLPEVKSRTRVSNQDAFEISPGRTPLHIALGHELVHFNHFIEIDGKLDKYGQPKVNRSDGNQPAGREATGNYAVRDRFKYPELEAARVGYSALFENAEERKTVIGKGRNSKSPDDGISEMSLRMEAGLNPRYIYQNQMPRSSFLESADTVRQVIGDRNYQIMAQLPFKNFALPARGSAQEEHFLRYTPLNILREISPLDKKQQFASVSGTGPLTIKDRQQRLAPEKRLHRNILSVMAKDIGYNGDLNNIHNYVRQNDFRNATRNFMKQNVDAYGKAINTVSSNNILQNIAAKFAKKQSTYNSDQIIGTMQSLLNDNRGDLKIQRVSSNGTVDNNFKKILAAKLNRKLMKEFIRNV